MDDINLNGDELLQREKEEQERTTSNKKALIEAMQKSLGVVTQACKIVGVSRESYYRYYNADEDFKRACDDCSEIALDFAESKLYKQIEDNIPVSTIFFLKTKGKQRGYIERTENDTTLRGDKEKPVVIDLTVTGQALNDALDQLLQK